MQLITCYDGDCLLYPINTCTYWEVIRLDYMCGITGNRVFWADPEKPSGPKSIQISEKDKCNG